MIPQPTQAILTASKAHSQNYTALGSETTLKLDKMLVLSFDDILVFKNGLKLTKTVDYQLLNANGQVANANNVFITGIQFTTALVVNDKISIEGCYYGGQYLDYDVIQDYIDSGEFASTTPAAGKIPKAGTDGKIADGWTSFGGILLN